MSSGLNSWTREVVCSVIVPIRINPEASEKEAEEQVRQLFKECSYDGMIPIEVDKFNFTAIPLTEES